MRAHLLLSLVAAFLLGAGGVAEAADTKPNIVVILADDLGNADLGYRGSDARTVPLRREMPSEELRRAARLVVRHGIARAGQTDDDLIARHPAIEVLGHHRFLEEAGARSRRSQG